MKYQRKSHIFVFLSIYIFDKILIQQFVQKCYVGHLKYNKRLS